MAGDGGVAQAGAQGAPNYLSTFSKYGEHSYLPDILRICVCGSWRGSCCHCHGDSQGEKTSSIILDLFPPHIPL